MTNTERFTGITAFRALSCFAILSIGVFSNLPLNLQQAVQTSSLRGTQVILPVSNNMFLLPSNETTDYAGFHSNVEDETDIKMEFMISGFPKCGTTTLLRTFEQHPETVVPPMEECSLDQIFNDDNAYSRLTGNLASATNSTSKDIKRGIKCPFGLTTPMAIERLEDWFPNTRLIFGMRHPVMQFQSYYNYRVLNFHKGEIEGPVPPPESLIGPNDWVRVSTEMPRFEKVLEKLGKTEKSEEPMTPFKVFLYTLEQMEDDDTERDASFRKTLGDFLQLKTPIEPLPQANINFFQGKKGFEETIDICDSKHDHLRSVLVENGKKTRDWILNEFLKSPDVTVANVEHFTETVSQWGLDPCVKEEEKEIEE